MWRVRTTISGLQGGPYLNTMYYNVVGGLTAANAHACTATFWNAIKGSIVAGASIVIEGEVASIDILTGNVTSITPVTPTTVASTSGGDALPWVSQGLIRLRTGTYVNGREVRGRWFIPGAVETNNDVGRPNSTYVTLLNNAVAAVIADATTDLMVYSKKNRDAVPVVSGSAWGEWASLRSRRA